MTTLGTEVNTALDAPALPFIDLLGVRLHHLTAEQAIDHVMSELSHGRGGWVLTPNIDILRRMVINPSYAEVVSGATLRLADGMPLIWASRLQRTSLPERVAGSELIWSLTARAAKEGRSVFFLGGNPGVAEAAADRLRELNPGLRVAGTECPALGFERDEAYLAQLEQKLRTSAPDICYVALSAPKQDLLIQRLRPRFPHTWFLGIGISFSFVAGEVRQAPVWIRRIGLEWLTRLLQEPRRLGRRYLIDGIPFACRLFWTSGLRGVGLLRPPPRPGRSGDKESGCTG